METDAIVVQELINKIEQLTIENKQLIARSINSRESFEEGVLAGEKKYKHLFGALYHKTTIPYA